MQRMRARELSCLAAILREWLSVVWEMVGVERAVKAAHAHVRRLQVKWLCRSRNGARDRARDVDENRSLKSAPVAQVWQQLEAALAEQQRQREDAWMPVAHELRRRTLLSRHFVSVRWYASWQCSKRRASRVVARGRALSSRQHLQAWWRRVRLKTDHWNGSSHRAGLLPDSDSNVCN